MSTNKTSKVVAIDSSVKWRGLKDVVSTANLERRYSIQGDDSGHEYFVEVGMEGEFERWLVAELYEHIERDPYDGYDYEKNRIDGRFTFTDPRCE